MFDSVAAARDFAFRLTEAERETVRENHGVLIAAYERSRAKCRDACMTVPPPVPTADDIYGDALLLWQSEWVLSMIERHRVLFALASTSHGRQFLRRLSVGALMYRSAFARSWSSVACRRSTRRRPRRRVSQRPARARSPGRPKPDPGPDRRCPWRRP
jgi:hypothetical protein